MTRRGFLAAMSWLMVFGMLLSIAVESVSQAQGRITELRVLREDHGQFPQIRLDVRALGLDGSSVAGLAAADFRVYENGQERDADEAIEQSSGIQVAVILDLAGSIDKPGASGRPVRDEAVEVIQQLFQDPSPLDFEGRSDQVMLIVPTGQESFEVREDWGSDYGRLYNAAYAHLDSTPPAYTPLYSMLVSAMTRMKEVPGYESTPKYVVVVSDGVDRTSVEHVTDVINRANALDVQIVSIKVGPSNLGDAENLRRMASMTNGAMRAYTGPESVDAVWQALGNRRLYYQMGYRSALSQSGVHSLRVAVVSDGGILQSDPIEVNLDLQPPAVTITDPTDGIIDRLAAWDGDRAVISPESIPVSLTVSFPDGRARAVTRITYLVNGAVMADLTADETFVWDLRDLDPGNYSLQARVTDEWGQVGESALVSVQLQLGIAPLSVEVVHPSQGLVIEREARSWNDDPASIEPQTLPISVDVTSADGRSRSLDSISYLVNGAIVAALPAQEAFVWDLGNLPSGTYTLQARVEDPWGMVGESAPVTVRVNVVIPPAPPINWVLLALLVLMSGLVLYLWIARPQVVQRVAKAVGETIPRLMVGRGKAPRARAYLVRLDGAGAELTRHPVVRQALNIGRSGSRSDLVIDEPTVSGLHAQLQEETDGVFSLRDEGSTNGTYVNLEPISAAGVRLEDGDLIHLGPDVTLRFERKGAQTVPDVGDATAAEDGKEKTLIDAARPWSPGDDGR